MIRAIELLLFAAPLGVYAMWRMGWFRNVRPTRQTLIVGLAGLLALGAALAWAGLRERHPESSRYVPAEMRDGQIVPGHDT